MILLVTYDLVNPGKDYSLLYEALKEAPAWWHYLESTWLIKTNLSPQQWFNKLKPFIDDNDRIFIMEITKNYQGWLPRKAWDWIHRHEY